MRGFFGDKFFSERDNGQNQGRERQELNKYVAYALNSRGSSIDAAAVSSVSHISSNHQAKLGNEFSQ